jgi:DNA-binding XRE family transcriptional regulator
VSSQSKKPRKQTIPEWALRFKKYRGLFWKQEKLARLLEVAQQKISAFERGNYRPSPDLWIRFANLLAAKKKYSGVQWCLREAGIEEVTLRGLVAELDKIWKEHDKRIFDALPIVDDPDVRKFSASPDYSLADENLVRFDSSGAGLLPLVNRTVLVEFDSVDGKRYSMGRFRIEPDPQGLWTAWLGPLTDRIEATQRPTMLGQWKQSNFDPSVIDKRMASRELTHEGRALQKEACHNVRLQPGIRILGRAMAWFAIEPPKK